MDTTGYDINVSTRERVTALMALLAEAKGRLDTGAIGGINRTDRRVRPDNMNLSLLTHYQRDLQLEMERIRSRHVLLACFTNSPSH